MSSTEMQEMENKKRKSRSSSSSSDSEVEKHEGGGDVPDETDDPEVQFIQPNHAEGDTKLDLGAPKVEFSGLTKEELMKYANDPFWKKVRWVLFILFWVLWAGMLIAAILIIVFTPKCPMVPKQKFWQKSSGYHIDVSTFKDSDGDGVGDLKGVTSKVDYLKTKGGYMVLSSILKGSLGSAKVRSAGVTDFKAVDPLIGSLDDVKAFMKQCRKNGLKAVIEFILHTGKDHEWFQKAVKGEKRYQNYYIWTTSGSSKMVNRAGKAVWNKISSASYWSSIHETVPALNLSNSIVLDELKVAVQFWLKEGFDGIYIDNAAFLSPDVDTSDLGKGLDVKALSAGDLKKWYQSGHNGQLHSAGSISFIQQIRKWVDEIEKQTDRERLLLVSSGNTGLQQNREKTLAFLGNPNSPGAHSVVLYDLVSGQGAKVVKSSDSTSLRNQIDNALALGVENGTITLVTQTLSGPRYPDATLTSLNLLLPGTALSLYGEEIGIVGYKQLEKAKRYPKPAYWYLTEAAMADATKYKDDLVDSYDVPMQWTSSGGFSTYNVTKPMVFRDANVMSLSTIGRGTTRLNVFDELIKLRKQPSLNWGALEWIESQEKREPNYYIFTRSAAGFPKILVVIVKPTKQAGGIASNMAKVCKEGTAMFSYPSNEEFKKDAKLPLNNIYFRFNNMGSLYIFKCV